MKIDEMADLQDILKCNKDKAYVKELKAERKKIVDEHKTLKAQIEALRKKSQDLHGRAIKINKIIAQSRGIVIVNDMPLTIVRHGGLVKIDKVGNHLDSRWPRSDFEITVRKNVVERVYAGGKIFHHTKWDSFLKKYVPTPLKPTDQVIDLACQFLSGQINVGDLEAQIRS